MGIGGATTERGLITEEFDPADVSRPAIFTKTSEERFKEHKEMIKAMELYLKKEA